MIIEKYFNITQNIIKTLDNNTKLFLFLYKSISFTKALCIYKFI